VVLTVSNKTADFRKDPFCRTNMGDFPKLRVPIMGFLQCFYKQKKSRNAARSRYRKIFSACTDAFSLRMWSGNTASWIFRGVTGDGGDGACHGKVDPGQRRQLVGVSGRYWDKLADGRAEGDVVSIQHLTPSWFIQSITRKLTVQISDFSSIK
jgi:hypothetical protein